MNIIVNCEQQQQQQEYRRQKDKFLNEIRDSRTFFLVRFMHTFRCLRHNSKQINMCIFRNIWNFFFS